jgi:hypothetical protein
MAKINDLAQLVSAKEAVSTSSNVISVTQNANDTITIVLKQDVQQWTSKKGATGYSVTQAGSAFGGEQVTIKTPKGSVPASLSVKLNIR